MGAGLLYGGFVHNCVYIYLFLLYFSPAILCWLAYVIVDCGFIMNKSISIGTGSIVDIPIEFLEKFIEEPERAVLEYLSIPAGSTNPFFRNSHKVREAIERGKGRPNPFDEETYLFDPNFKSKDHNPRYMHIDLAINRDVVGISMCHASGFVERKIKDAKGKDVIAQIPYVTFDFTARLKPRIEFGEKD